MSTLSPACNSTIVVFTISDPFGEPPSSFLDTLIPFTRMSRIIVADACSVGVKIMLVLKVYIPF